MDKLSQSFKRSWIDGTLYIVHIKSGNCIAKIVQRPRFLGIFGKKRFKMELVGSVDATNFRTVAEADSFAASWVNDYEKILNLKDE